MMLATLSALALLASAPNASMGTLSFPITGNKECQRRFNDGMLAMHSFMYDEAHAQFRAAIKADPGCSMARWGDAMAYTHPLWGEEELALSRAAVAEINNEAKLKPVERAFIATAKTLWGDADYRARQKAWLRATETMRAEFPKDDEVALQHALALIANSERLTKTKLLMQAVAISMDVLRRRPNHPGAAHYLIHSADTPDHAILALDAARQYAKIAPAASHALHMPSHIFVHLGMYEETARSNEAAWAASEKDHAKSKLRNDERDWHSYSWLMAAYLELGQVQKAEKLLADLRELLSREEGASMRVSYALMAQAYVRSTGKWDQVDALLAPVLRPIALEPGESAGSMGCALHAPGSTGKTRPPFGLLASMQAAQLRAEAAMRRGDEKAVAAAIESAKKISEAMAPWKSMTPPDMAERASRHHRALLAGAKARAKKTKQAWDDAIAAAKSLAEMRETIPIGPAFETPYSHLLGELLMEAGRPKEALAAFDAALSQYQMHAPTLLAAARAAEAAGEHEIARERYAALAAQWRNADAALASLVAESKR